MTRTLVLVALLGLVACGGESPTEPASPCGSCLCVLAYYVRWHMVEAWRPLLFADEDQAAKQTRDRVPQA
jgi:hypothetical protein